nr:hypothetical protein B0A51_13027 [Rachicladosporium sp. CCFEE 5018]
MGPSSSSDDQPSSAGRNRRPSPILNPATTSTSAISTSSNTPLSTPRKEGALSPSVSHRSSFAENLRSYPPSPRTQRQHSFSGAALAELLKNPPVKMSGDERFRGRDWRSIGVAEITDPDEVRFVQMDSSIEGTTKLLVKSGAPNVILVRESTKTKTAIATFDYSDLNAYLLLVLGLSAPDGSAGKLADRARTGEAIPLADLLDHLGAREMPAFLPHTADLTKAMEVLGGGSHRLIIVKEGTSEVVGVLSQLRLVRFFWENHQNFSATESLYARALRELRLGDKEVLSINGDAPLKTALQIMNDEGVTSLPVLDNQKHVVGNISHVDVRLLTDTSSIPLLTGSCIHFISVILSERGMADGKDSFPVFHVNPTSTLSHTVAKLVATRSHRMWIVEAPSPATSVPPSPSVHSVAMPPFSLQHNNNSSGGLSERSGSSHSLTGPPYTNTAPGVSVTAAQMQGQNMSGRLSGVVSLTDVLNLFARASGLSPRDPEEERQRRRRSSSASLRPSMEGVRPSAELLSGSGELRRSGSGAAHR